MWPRKPMLGNGAEYIRNRGGFASEILRSVVMELTDELMDELPKTAIG